MKIIPKLRCAAVLANVMIYRCMIKFESILKLSRKYTTTCPAPTTTPMDVQDSM